VVAVVLVVVVVVVVVAGTADNFVVEFAELVVFVVHVHYFNFHYYLLSLVAVYL